MKSFFFAKKQDSSASQEEYPIYQTQVRSSIYQLFLTIVLGLAGIDLLYTVGTFFLSKIYLIQSQPLPFDLHHHVLILMFVLGISKTIIQFIWISTSIVRWASKSFTISQNQLIHRIGIFNIKETLHDLRNMRSVTVDQSWLGKIFHFGDIHVEISASGGFKEFICLMAIPNPKQFQQLLSSQSTHYSNSTNISRVS